jgi:hypothetical protein
MRSKHLTKLLGALVAAVTAIAMVAPVAQATTPAEGYEAFAGCTSSVENINTQACVRSVITSGHFQMGSKDVPISNPITLSGGVEADGNLIFNSKGGLTPVKQLVPGGVIGLTGLDWLVNFLNLEALKLYAVTELAGPVNVAGVTLALPLKVHLINPVLGSKCYVGSVANPISLNLTLGTTTPPPPNEPITGTAPSFTFDGATGIVHGDNGTFVDNSFAAPGASGCTLTLLGFLPVSLDGIVNVQAGLPSPAGNNETVQNFDTELAPLAKVYP